jgi:anti-sigma factor RsiW
MNRHWNIDELIDRLYGLREADEHLGSCGECGRRLQELQARRAAVTAAAPVRTAMLVTQRRAVLDRIEAPSRRMLRWVPALTAACLLAAGVYVYRPMHAPLPHPESSDAQLFADIYSVEESAEPRAAAPMHELFQEGQQ